METEAGAHFRCDASLLCNLLRVVRTCCVSLEGIKFKPETYRKEQRTEDEKLTREMGEENQRLHSPTGRDKGAEWVACGGRGPEMQLPLELPTIF